MIHVSNAKLRSSWRSAILIAMAIAAGFVPSAHAGEPLEGLDEYITAAMADWEVPGLAIAIVKDDVIVWAKGFGVRTVGENTPVDAETLFAIGSTTKAFTAAALAMLVDEGKLKWDDAATLRLPKLELHDPYATRELTVRDLLCHRSGLPRGDLLWYGTNYDRGEVLRRLRHLKPSWSFRSQFGYQNIMFLAAGEIIPHVAGQSWDDFVKQRIFLPLGMKSACTSVNELAANDNVATPHDKIDDKIKSIAWRNIDNIGPAGSINANVSDMAQWLRLQLGQGEIDGKRIVSAEAIEEMHTAQSVVSFTDYDRRLYPDAHFLNYGLGWFLQDYHGRKILEHGGAIDGMRAQVALVPEKSVGLVILCNRGGSGLPTPLMFHVLDRYLNVSGRDWSAEVLAKTKAAKAKADEKRDKQEAKRVQDTKPSLALEAYVGTYTDELYGDAEVKLVDDKLVLRRGPAFVADLQHWHYDTFRVIFRDRTLDPQMATFQLDASGKVNAVELPRMGEFTKK